MDERARELHKVCAVILAAGSSSRMREESLPAGASGKPEGSVPREKKKQFLTLQDKPLICHSLSVFESSGLIGDIVLVAAPEDVVYCEENIVSAYGFSKVKRVVSGGSERYHSVYEGLKALGETGKREIVLIHDGARPFVTEEILYRTAEGAKRSGACVAAIPVRDTVKTADEHRIVTKTVDRRNLFAMQTPQAFHFDLAYEAYTRLTKETDGTFLSGLTDDAMVVERYFPDVRVSLAEGSVRNIKITTPDDLVIAQALCGHRVS